MQTIEQDRAYKVVAYMKSFSVDFDDMPYAWFDNIHEAIGRFNTDRLNWYGDIQ